METFIIHAETNKIESLIAFLKALDISFEIKKPKTKEVGYNPEFVAMVLKSRQQYKEGEFTTIKTEELWK